MPRAYTVATTALALDTSPKWVDNVLSHYRLPGIVQAKQGIPRRLNVEGLLHLSIILLLTGELGTTVSVAVKIAGEIAAAGGALDTPGGVRIQLDLDALRTRLLARLDHAVEVAPIPRRGRPPKNTTGRLE
jgi:hypothetical protein